MKHLANCAPTEFMAQCVKLRRPFQDWLEKTGIPEIRQRKPEGFDAMKPEEQASALMEQGAENIGDILAAAMEKDPHGTAEIMALCCFTEPEDVDKHPMPEYLDAIIEMFTNKAVRGFFMYFLKSKPRTSSKG